VDDINASHVVSQELEEFGKRTLERSAIDGEPW